MPTHIMAKFASAFFDVRIADNHNRGFPPSQIDDEGEVFGKGVVVTVEGEGCSNVDSVFIAGKWDERKRREGANCARFAGDSLTCRRHSNGDLCRQRMRMQSNENTSSAAVCGLGNIEDQSAIGLIAQVPLAQATNASVPAGVT